MSIFKRTVEARCLMCKTKEKPHKAKGFCENCYRKYKRANPDKDAVHK